MLKILEEFLIHFIAELAMAPQSRYCRFDTQKFDVFKQVFHCEKNILEKFQLDFWHLGCFILKIVEGFFILFQQN